MVVDAVGCTQKQSIIYMILPVELKNSRLSGPDCVHLRSFTLTQSSSPTSRRVASMSDLSRPNAWKSVRCTRRLSSPSEL
jgi:hypothetical protein